VRHTEASGAFMPKKEKYRCLNCGERFKVDLYSPEETRDAQREGVRFSQIRCPACGQSSYREGWD
jgi:DNA-directed RNA polymerase subunit RPC12/RpoP